MTPEDHYQEAERLLRWLDVVPTVTAPDVALIIVAISTVAHALLADGRYELTPGEPSNWSRA